MASRYLLEDGSGYYLLEDGTSYYLLEPPVITVASLATYNESSGAGNVISKTTGSLSIPTDGLVVVFAQASDGATSAWSGTLTVTDSVDGATGWNAVDVLQNPVGPASETFQAGRAYYKQFTGSVSARTITMARSTGTAYWGYQVVAVTGHDTTTPFVQGKGAGTMWNDSGNSHTQDVVLGAAPTSGNLVLWFIGVNNDGVAASAVPSGYTSLSALSATFEATSAASNQATTAATLSSTDVGQQVQATIAFAMEIKAQTESAVNSDFFMCL